MTEAISTTPPVLTASSGPSEKERKYDRQLRLWAASGQAALESTNILLVNSGCATAGIETLKNLILPGIGSFAIFDDAKVQDEDLGVNFFLDDTCRGRSRAESCTERLMELNPEVQGTWYPKPSESSSLSEVLASVSPFTAVLYTLPMDKSQVEVLHTYASEHAIPILSVHSAGFYSYFQISLPGVFPIVDTHPDETATTDLRLLNPWPALSEFAKSMTGDMESLSDHEHGHLPLVVILLQHLETWKADHEGKLPLSYVDKTSFRAKVQDSMRTNNAEGGEENFEEAAAAVMKHVVQPTLPSSLKQVFEYENQSQESSNSGFWTIAAAVRQFHDRHGALPLAGGLPDMKAESGVYIQLQNIYKEKARQDALEVLKFAQDTPGSQPVTQADVELFCKNARFVKLVNVTSEGTKSISEVLDAELSNDEVALIAGPEVPMSLLPIYLALSATSHSATATAEQILANVAERAPAALHNDRVGKAAQEVARSGGGELHNISALTGGMVAQEMIKVITRQYVPIDNTCIFDGVDSRCQVLRL